MLLQKSKLSLAALAFMATAFFLPSGMALAVDTTGTPAAQFVQKMGDKALTSLTDKKLDRAVRETRVRNLLRENFDVSTISRFALGTYWRKATPAERNEYTKLFEDMIVQTYAARFEEYEGQSFKVLGTQNVGDTDFIVASQIIQQGGPPVNVDWRIRKRDSGLKVIDVVVEDISMSVTQRSDFNAVIQAGGGEMEALLKELRAKKKSSLAQASKDNKKAN
jgi:phospholipid transport system substrate-binding protein